MYRLLYAGGVPQREIARRTGQKQSEVSEIIKGRQVMAYEVLVRIAEGLGAPRGWMGLAFAPGCDPQFSASTLDGQAGVGTEDNEDVRRRNLLKHGGAVLFGTAAWGAPEPVQVRVEDLAHSSSVGMADVDALEAATAQFRALDRQYGGVGILDAVQALYRQGDQLISSASSTNVRKRMAAALADLGNLAGWVANDVGLGDVARAHMHRALDFAGAADNQAVIANTEDYSKPFPR